MLTLRLTKNHFPLTEDELTLETTYKLGSSPDGCPIARALNEVGLLGTFTVSGWGELNGRSGNRICHLPHKDYDCDVYIAMNKAFMKGRKNAFILKYKTITL